MNQDQSGNINLTHVPNLIPVSKIKFDENIRSIGKSDPNSNEPIKTHNISPGTVKYINTDPDHDNIDVHLLKDIVDKDIDLLDQVGHPIHGQQNTHNKGRPTKSYYTAE